MYVDAVHPVLSMFNMPRSWLKPIYLVRNKENEASRSVAFGP